MKKTLLCNIAMTNNTKKSIYRSDDFSIPASETEVCFPVCAFLEKTLTEKDELEAILLVKKDAAGQFEEKLDICINELKYVEQITGAKIEIKTIMSEFEESKQVHENLLLSIVEELEANTHIIADITYGPKDLPVVLFTALNFAEKYLNCEVDNIIYGKADFIDGIPTNTKICDMVPLYYLNTITNTVQCSSPDKAKQMLRTLLSI